MEILGRLIHGMKDEVERLNDLLTYTKCGLESHAYEKMQEMWN